MADRLFVYGTLAPGQPNEHILEGVPGTWEPAAVTGNLVARGWGAAVGFPAIVLDEHGPEVHGLLFTSDELGDHWKRLDEFEGDGYQRVLSSARLPDGRTVTTYIYVLRASP
jgi:gamma-glutamylcyclotransferase (GGCT)/AIG2-like uncharacterized protein YtfP